MFRISLLLGILLSACVTINIYFPEAAAEEAARVIVRDVLQEDPAKKEPSNPEKNPAEKPSAYQIHPTLYLLAWTLEKIVPAVQAGQANININTAAIKKLRRSMANRQKLLKPYYRSGAIGFNEKGLVSIRSLKSVPLSQRNRLKKWVAAENKDRNALYREIARANHHPEWENEIRQTFAKVWIQEAPKGYWYHRGGRWHKK